jgi:hypothetical protein
MMSGQQFHQPGPQTSRQPEDGFLRHIGENPLLVNTAKHMFDQTASAYMPGISGFWASLKAYFMVRCVPLLRCGVKEVRFGIVLTCFRMLRGNVRQVNNRYVLQKLQTLFLPFMQTHWNRMLMEEVDQSMPVRGTGLVMYTNDLLGLTVV